MLNCSNTGLVVVDIQGKLATLVDASESLIANTRVLVAGAKILNLPIIVLEQNSSKLGATSASIRQVLGAVEPIAKTTFNGSGEPEFVQAINDSQIKHWLVCGIEAHICVYQTALGLLNLGCEVELVVDCVSSRAAVNKTLAISKLASKGVGLTCVEMCLYELLGDCERPEFKQILQLIK